MGVSLCHQKLRCPTTDVLSCPQNIDFVLLPFSVTVQVHTCKHIMLNGLMLLKMALTTTYSVYSSLVCPITWPPACCGMLLFGNDSWKSTVSWQWKQIWPGFMATFPRSIPSTVKCFHESPGVCSKLQGLGRDEVMLIDGEELGTTWPHVVEIRTSQVQSFGPCSSICNFFCTAWCMACLARDTWLTGQHICFLSIHFGYVFIAESPMLSCVVVIVCFLFCIVLQPDYWRTLAQENGMERRPRDWT